MARITTLAAVAACAVLSSCGGGVDQQAESEADALATTQHFNHGHSGNNLQLRVLSSTRPVGLRRRRAHRRARAAPGLRDKLELSLNGRPHQSALCNEVADGLEGVVERPAARRQPARGAGSATAMRAMRSR